jgi:hypothetical protein
MGFVSLNPSYRRFPDAAQRDSGATLIRDRYNSEFQTIPVLQRNTFVLRCARDTCLNNHPVFTAA